MSSPSATTDHQIGILPIDGQKYLVSLRITYDGVEYVGRLLFTEESTGIVYQDHGAIPGISAMDAVRKAREFSEGHLEQRCYRAMSEKRRFGKLRRATDQMIEKIRYMNRVAVGLEKGLLDPASGNRELDQAQNELLEIVRSLRLFAGVEDEAPRRAIRAD